MYSLIINLMKIIKKIMDEMVAEVKQFAEMVKDREAKKRNNK